VKDPASWKIAYREMGPKDVRVDLPEIHKDPKQNTKICAVNLPGFKGILSHFTQPGKMFADEITDRLKVVACIEKPNMIHSELLTDSLGEKSWTKVRTLLKSGDDDAQVIFWGPEADVKTALETIEERCQMAFKGIPNETRKSFEDGTTIFERVLPGADRMYPDTDSAPIPLEDSYIEEKAKNRPVDIFDRLNQLKDWNVPDDAHTFILKNNLVPLIEKINGELGIPARFTATLLAHQLKSLMDKYPWTTGFSFGMVYDLLAWLKSRDIDSAISRKMLRHLYEHPKMDFESVLITIGFRKIDEAEITGKLPFLIKKYSQVKRSKDHSAGYRWIMGSLSKSALGNMPLAKLREMIRIE
jgi:glutamyl-tRNA(Gln) amidotransferase subunit E